MTSGDGPLPVRHEPWADLTAECLARLLEDMQITQPGPVSTGRLYRYYEAMCMEDDLWPIGVRRFGVAMRELGYFSKTRRIDGTPTRCWILTNRAFRAVLPRKNHPALVMTSRKARTVNSGDPDQVYAGVKVVDVVHAIRTFTTGFHTIDEVHQRYREVTGVDPVAEGLRVVAVVSRFAMDVHTQTYERGWYFDMDRLKSGWPRLPWVEMPPNAVGCQP